MGLRVDVLFPNPDISLGKLSPLEKGIGTCLLKKNSILKIKQQDLCVCV